MKIAPLSGVAAALCFFSSGAHGYGLNVNACTGSVTCIDFVETQYGEMVDGVLVCLFGQTEANITEPGQRCQVECQVDTEVICQCVSEEVAKKALLQESITPIILGVISIFIFPCIIAWQCYRRKKFYKSVDEFDQEYKQAKEKEDKNRIAALEMAAPIPPGEAGCCIIYIILIGLLLFFFITGFSHLSSDYWNGCGQRL